MQDFHVAQREWTVWCRFSSIALATRIRRRFATHRRPLLGLSEPWQGISKLRRTLQQPLPTYRVICHPWHVPLQVDDSACRGIGSDQWDSDPEDRAERVAAGAQVSTSTSSGGPPNTSGVGGENAPPRDVDIIPLLPTGLGPMPYNIFYGDGPAGFTEEFRVKFSIPDDGLIERVTTDMISFCDDFIVLPLSAITEGGTIRLAESNNLSFSLGDLMLMYMVSRSPKYDKYYLTTHQYFDHLVDCLYDIEKWENVLVKIAQHQTRDSLSPAGITNTVPGPGSLYLGLPEQKEQLEPIPTDQPVQQDHSPVDVTTEKPHSGHRRERHSARGEGSKGQEKAKAVENVEVLPTDLAEDDPANPSEPLALFIPDFKCSDRHVITVRNSLEESPLLAMTLLKGLALPKDMENLLTGKAKNKAELCLFLAKGDLQPKRKEAEQLADQIEVLEAKVAEAKTVRQERDRLLLKIKDVKAENDRHNEEKKQMEEDLPRKLEEAGDVGYNEAGEYYQQLLQSLVTKAFKEGELKGIKDTHKFSFLRGYQVDLDYAEVPEVDHRREPPVVPPVELSKNLLPAEQPNPTTDTQPNRIDMDGA
ncbi:hypothetical protein RHSIM_Rhsim05G0097200 [Rhododendron simsii]|uniref:Uncharacterized protein n=1 Tax=Rhododendron simsii TaxID=118357 RepID=A0A834LPA7_RHOSS|nr:hypothetical protein RHSIM_Rhsim05G0097200 [Rhododendron simsii]